MSQFNLETTIKKTSEHDFPIQAAWPSIGDRPSTGDKPSAVQNDQTISIALQKSGLLPDFQLTGFEKEGSPKKNESAIDSIIHKVKGFFGQDETLGEQIKDKVINNLKPEEKKAYDDEAKQLEAYQSAVKHWSTLLMSPPPPYPEKPNTPMHTEVERQTLAQEKQIAARVRAQMSPEDQKRVDKQLADYEGFGKPISTNPEGFRKPAPEPGNALKDYWDRIREATDTFTQS